MRPHRRQPTRLPCPWDSQGKNTGVGCHVLLQCMKVKSESEVSQSCPTLSNPMDCSPPGSSIHGISQARVLEWGAIAFSNLTSMQSTNAECQAGSTQAGIKIVRRNINNLIYTDNTTLMVTHSSILAWRIPWTEEPGRLKSMGFQESDTT